MRRRGRPASFKNTLYSPSIFSTTRSGMMYASLAAECCRPGLGSSFARSSATFCKRFGLDATEVQKVADDLGVLQARLGIELREGVGDLLHLGGIEPDPLAAVASGLCLGV